MCAAMARHSSSAWIGTTLACTWWITDDHTLAARILCVIKDISKIKTTIETMYIYVRLSHYMIH